MEDERFSACLKRLMENRERYDHVCSAKCLALAVRVGADAARRWRSGALTPGLASAHIGNIVRHLRLTDAEAQELDEAQVRSRRDGPKPRRPRRTPKRPTTSDAQHDASAGSPVRKLTEPGAQPYGPADRDPADVAPTSHATASGENILEDITQLLESLPDGTRRADKANTITLTWQGRDDAFDDVSDALRKRWQTALRSVLRRGWRVRHLCRLDSNVERTVHLVELMLDFLGAGAYFPYYFTTYGTLTPPYDLLVVPGVAAAWLFSSSSRHRVDAGNLTRNPAQVEQMVAHAGQLFGQTTRLVSAYFSAEDDEGANAAYLSALQKSEAHPGGRIAVMDGLTAITQPEAWFDLEQPSRYTAFPTFEAWRARHASRRMSITPFKRFVEKYDYYDICTERAVVELCTNGEYYSRLRDTFQPEKQLLLEHLHNIVDLLSRSRYRLALVSDHQRSDRDPNGVHIDTAWTVTGDNSVFLETWIPDETGRPKAASLHITEPTVAEGFRKYFRQLWGRIPPQNSDKESVIRWLEGKIAELERDGPETSR